MTIVSQKNNFQPGVFGANMSASDGRRTVLSVLQSLHTSYLSARTDSRLCPVLSPQNICADEMDVSLAGKEAP